MKECRKCGPGCTACDKGKCRRCDSSKGYVLNEEAKCIKREACDTADGFTISDGVCQRCHLDCARCGGGVSSANSMSDSPLFCTTCRNPLKFLHQGQCLDTCPSDFAENISKQIRICTAIGPAGAAYQSPLTQARILLSKGTDSVINQVHPVTLLAQFPVLFLLLLPNLMLRKCQQTGRTAPSGKEIMLLTFSGLEYLGTLFLGIKGLVCIQQFEQGRKERELEVKDDFVLIYVALSLISVAYILIHHLTNEYFYR